MTQWHGGKGSDVRPTDKDKFAAGYERAFGKNKGLKGLDGAESPTGTVSDGGSIPPSSTILVRILRFLGVSKK